MQRSVIRMVNCWISEHFLTSQKVLASQSSSARVIIYIIYYKKDSKKSSGAGVTVNGMSGTEGQDPGGTDPIDLQLPRGATGNSREQSTPQSTAPITRFIDTESLLQVTPCQGDNDKVFSYFSFFYFILCSFFVILFSLSLFISLFSNFFLPSLKKTLLALPIIL